MNILLGIIIGILLTFIAILTGIFFSNSSNFNKLLQKAKKTTMPKGMIIPAESIEDKLKNISKSEKNVS